MLALTKQLVAAAVPLRQRESYKGTYGHVVCIGGNAQYGGAILLAAQAAQRMGAGLVSVVCDQNHHQALRVRTPEIMAYDWRNFSEVAQVVTRADVIVIGCGLGRDEFAHQYVRFICEQQCPVVFDADALYWLATDPTLQPQMPRIYTPHLGEWARFTHDQAKTQQQQACAIAPVVVLKSAATIIYTPTQCYQLTNGTPAMASGGMGDCLAGSIAGWYAQSRKLDAAALVGAWVHSEAATRLAQTQYSVSASEVIQQFPTLLAELAQQK
ncbi:MAG: NAD(P)H-hydrate dehydratase [Culicoidibacterales bacterium]